MTDVETIASEEENYLPFFWLLTRDVLIRVRNKPRRGLCTPIEDANDPSPIPARFIDRMRRTATSCASKAVAIIEDFWVDEADEHRELSDEWVGQTMFYLRRPAAKKGYEWQNCRGTKVQRGSTRPPSVWVEGWRKWNDAKRQIAIFAWEKEKRDRDACRSSHGLVQQIPRDQTQEYKVLIAERLGNMKTRSRLR